MTTPYCEGCETETLALNLAGYCAKCSEVACQNAEGNRVGLPAIADVDIFKVRMALDRTDDMFALELIDNTEKCSECDTDVKDMDKLQARSHYFGPYGTILIGCEGYHTALMRAGAKLVLGLRP